MPLKPLVFIPGLPGTEILDAANGVQLFPSLLSLTSATMRPKLVQQLSGPDDPNADDGVVPGEPISSVIKGVRSSFIDFSGTLKQAQSLYDILSGLGYTRFGRPYGDLFRPVGWDWRRPVDQAKVQRDVTAAVTELQQLHGEKVTVICHSTGGLVLRSLLEARPELADRLERVISIGVPWAGTLQSLSPLAGLSGFGPLNAQQTQQVLGRSWAAFDLLPPDPARTDMRDAEGNLDLFTDPGGPASPLVSTAWIPPGAGFDALRLRAASADRRLGARLRTLSLDGRTLPVVNLVGWGVDTLTGYRMDDHGGLTPSSSEEGDGTIPRRSAAWLQGSGVTTFLVPMGHTPDSQIESLHITLWQNPPVRDLLGVFLAGRPWSPYTYAAVDAFDAVDVFGDEVRVRAVAFDPLGRPLPGASVETLGARFPIASNGRLTLRIPRDRIVQKAQGGWYRLEVRFHWQDAGGPQTGPRQVLQIQKAG